MVPVIINTVVQLPFHVLNYALKKLRIVPPGATAQHTFPVAGLDEGRAHAVLYALRQAAMDVEVRSQTCRQLRFLDNTAEE